MISIQCGCGNALEFAQETGSESRECEMCGQRVRIACAEALPEGAAEGDFDAALVQRGGQGLRIALGGCAEISIGRLPENTICLSGQRVSRRHARLVRVDFGPSRWRIVDAGSSAGLFVNRQRVQEAELASGDTIGIGEHEFEYRVAAAPVDAPALAAMAAPPPPAAARGLVAQVRAAPARRTGGGFWTRGRIVSAVLGGLFVVVVAVALSVVLPFLSASRARAQSVACAAQLRLIGNACSQYQRKYGSYPRTLGELAAAQSLEARLFVCPGDRGRASVLSSAPSGGPELIDWINQNTSYAYAGPGLPGGVVVYDSAVTHQDHVNAAMFDGSVLRMPRADLQRRLSEPPAAQPLALAGRGADSSAPRGAAAAPAASLAEARSTFKTTLARKLATSDPLDQPPPGVFRIVHYDAPPGKLAAYLTPDWGTGRRHPAIIWITGGDCNTIGDVWSPADPDNDQTAAAYRQSGIVMMFPSLRGGNGNPGYKEGLYGEVDDILAAAQFLASVPYVDPARIYLGGHSTGGTLVLLVAECSDRFRAVFSFGPVTSVVHYDEDTVPRPYNIRNVMEMRLRSPVMWLHGIRTPTFIFEGMDEPGNEWAIREMATAARSPQVQLFLVVDKDHFSVLAPLNQLIAGKILRDTGPATNITFAANEVPGLAPLGRPR